MRGRLESDVGVPAPPLHRSGGRLSSSLYRLGRAMAAAGWKIVALWAALLIAVGVLGVGLGGTFSTDFEIPGTEAQSGIDNLATRFPEMGGTAGQVVFVADDGAPIEEHQAQIDDVMAEIGDRSEERRVGNESEERGA